MTMYVPRKKTALADYNFQTGSKISLQFFLVSLILFTPITSTKAGHSPAYTPHMATGFSPPTDSLFPYLSFLFESHRPGHWTIPALVIL